MCPAPTLKSCWDKWHCRRFIQFLPNGAEGGPSKCTQDSNGPFAGERRPRLREGRSA